MAGKVDTTKINKKQRLAEIDSELKKCEEYLKTDPDPMAENRVKALDKNPCIEGMYYLNASYKNVQTEMSEALAKDPKYYVSISGCIPYGNEGDITCFIIKKVKGLFKDDEIVQYNSISELDEAIDELTKKTKSENKQKEIDSKTEELNKLDAEYSELELQSAEFGHDQTEEAIEHSGKLAKLDDKINALKEDIKKLNTELTDLNKSKLVSGEDFFAYVEFERFLNEFASKHVHDKTSEEELTYVNDKKILEIQEKQKHLHEQLAKLESEFTQTGLSNEFLEYYNAKEHLKTLNRTIRKIRRYT